LVIVLSGCGGGLTTSSNSSTTALINQGLMKSTDGGKSFDPIGKIDTTKNIGLTNVL
jgi:hypothetical protein